MLKRDVELQPTNLQYFVKRLARKNISEVTYFVSSGM